MKHRYFRRFPLWYPHLSQNGSCLWRKMRQLAPYIQLGSKWLIGDGKSVRLWFDVWLGSEAIADILPQFHFRIFSRVSELIDESRRWLIPNDLHPLIVQQLEATKLIVLSPSLSPFIGRTPHLASCLSLPLGMKSGNGESLYLGTNWLGTRSSSLPPLLLLGDFFSVKHRLIFGPKVLVSRWHLYAPSAIPPRNQPIISCSTACL